MGSDLMLAGEVALLRHADLRREAEREQTIGHGRGTGARTGIGRWRGGRARFARDDWSGVTALLFGRQLGQGRRADVVRLPATSFADVINPAS